MPLLEPVRKGSRIPKVTFSTNLSGWVGSMLCSLLFGGIFSDTDSLDQGSCWKWLRCRSLFSPPNSPLRPLRSLRDTSPSGSEDLFGWPLATSRPFRSGLWRLLVCGVVQLIWPERLGGSRM